MARVIVQADGVYYVADDGKEILLEGIARVDGTSGVVTVRFPSRDVVVRAPLQITNAIDMSDVLRCAIAIRRGGLTYAQLSAVRPGVATFLQNQGVVEGSVE